MNDALATLCLNHLHHEEAMLKAALDIVGAIKSAFGERRLDAFSAALGRHRELLNLVGDIQRRRRQFAEAVAGPIGARSEDVTISAVLERVVSGEWRVASKDKTPLSKQHSPLATRHSPLVEAAARVRKLAHELAAANFVVSVHVRVHLDAYRRLLRDLTNTKNGSGCYSRAGHAEVLEYRPMLQIGA